MKYLLLLLLTTTVLADDLTVKYGPGVFQSAKNGHETLNATLGYQKELLYLLSYQIEVGGWSDKRIDLGRRSSMYGSYSIGSTVNASYMYAEAFLGVAGITNPDSYLGGHFQFNNDLGIGFRDKYGKRIGINYKHMSSAGLYNPNVGRDFLLLKLSFDIF